MTTDAEKERSEFLSLITKFSYDNLTVTIIIIYVKCYCRSPNGCS